MATLPEDKSNLKKDNSDNSNGVVSPNKNQNLSKSKAAIYLEAAAKHFLEAAKHYSNDNIGKGDNSKKAAQKHLNLATEAESEDGNIPTF